MKKYYIATCILAVLAGIALYLNLLNKSEVEKELRKIKINDISFFLTQESIQKKFGIGLDDTEGCFGCEMNFIYPELQLSGRYSETLDRNFNERKSPKVKSITTVDKTISVFDIHVGDTFKKAIQTLKTRGFAFQDNENDYFYNYFYKDNVYIRIWVEDELYPIKRYNSYFGKDHEKVKAITIEYRVRKDEEILY